MNMMRKILLTFICAFLVFSYFSFSQTDAKIGQWRTHLPYHVGFYVTQSNTHVYWTSEISILKMNKTDFSIERLDKSNTLTDVVPKIIRYNKANETLLVTYQNYKIDLVKPTGETVAISDIKDNLNIIGDKSVNDVFFSGDTAYLACSFGVVLLNMKRNEFISTTFTKLKVTGITVHKNQIYAATEGGIFTTSNDARNNVLDFRNWRRLDEMDGFPSQYSTKIIASYNGNLYFNVNDSLCILNNKGPLSINYEKDFTVKFASQDGSNLLIGLACKDNCNGKVLKIDKNNKITSLKGNCIDRPNYAIEDAQGRSYFGDDYLGLRYSDNASGNCFAPQFDSPFFATSSDIAVTDSSIFVVAGGTDGFNGLQRAFGFSRFSNGNWRNFNRGNYPILADSSAELDFYRIVVNPANQKAYVGTYWGGIVEVAGNNITKIYNSRNSALQGTVGDLGRTRIGGMAYDRKGNLWVSNSGAANPIVVFKPDLKSVKMGSVPFGANFIFQLVIDSVGIKWMTVGGQQSGVLVFDEGKSVDDLSDDKIRLLDAGTFPKELQTAGVRCLATDLDGRMWVGTGSGVMVFECGNDPFSDKCKGRLVVSGLGGIGEYLLREKSVNAIAVDGANRKWFGTSSGIFVQSPDGREEILKFNTENSPLLSNVITALNIRKSTGEVFIGTDKGLMSYRSDAVAGSEFNTESPIVYPNPVRPDYDGPIAIKGLARDANVKITDVNGSIVFETRALGGQAIWNGRDFNGRRAATGVYLVFSANTRDPESGDAVVAKILFVN